MDDPSTEFQASSEAYQSASQRIIAALGKILAAGDRAQQRVATFYQQQGIEPGSGARALTSPQLPRAAREANRSLLSLQAAMARATLIPPAGGRPDAGLLAPPTLGNQPRRDAFTHWLATQRPGLKLRHFAPLGPSCEFDLGYGLEVGRTIVTYVAHEAWPDRLFVLHLEPTRALHGLHSPLLDLLAFVRLVQASHTGIQRLTLVLGLRSEPPPSVAYALALCCHYLPGQATKPRHETASFELELTNFDWSRVRRKVREPHTRRTTSSPTQPSRTRSAPRLTPSTAARALGNRTRI
jgi:hypothetical protein